MKLYLAALLGLFIVIGLSPGPRVSAEVPLPTPTPSFDVSATVTATIAPHLDVPGEQTLTGSNYIFYGPDGSQFHHYEQTNLVLTGASPTPSPTAAPTPSPTPSPSPTPAAIVTKFDDPAFTYFGTWGVYTGAGKYGPGDHFTSDTSASYGFLFTGAAVTLYTQTAPWMAIADVSVDGGPAVEFDAYAATQTQQVPFFRSGPLAPGVHRVIVRHSGRWNPAAAEHQMTVDRADITDGAIVAPLAQ